MLSIEERQRLFEEHLEWSKLVARRVASQLPPSFAPEDLEQEAALELWRQLDRYDPKLNDNVRGFAYLAVRGACLMSVRRKHYTEATNEPLGTSVPATYSDPADQYEKRLADQRNRRRELAQLREVARRLAGFPTQMQFSAYVVRRVHLESTAIPQLAELTGVPAEKLQRALAAGLRLLKKGQ
jgi:RNA polymerase sigma factor (sigma-70 family)